jgi:hypothetical protein
MTFLFKLETADGAAADPPTFKTAVPNWKPGDGIPLGRKLLRVVDVHVDEDESVLVVEEVGGSRDLTEAER